MSAVSVCRSAPASSNRTLGGVNAVPAGIDDLHQFVGLGLQRPLKSMTCDTRSRHPGVGSTIETSPSPACSKAKTCRHSVGRRWRFWGEAWSGNSTRPCLFRFCCVLLPLPCGRGPKGQRSRCFGLTASGATGRLPASAGRSSRGHRPNCSTSPSHPKPAPRSGHRSPRHPFGCAPGSHDPPRSPGAASRSTRLISCTMKSRTRRPGPRTAPRICTACTSFSGAE